MWRQTNSVLLKLKLSLIDKYKRSMKRKLLLLLLFALSSTVTFAQRERLDLTYKTAIGARFTPFGVSLKVNNAYRKRSVEAIAYFQDNTYVGTFLYYWNLTLDKKFTTRLYFGGGGQAGYSNKNDASDAFGGAVGVVGLDYKFQKLPINISLDWQPSFQFGDVEGFNGNYGGIALRFAF
jgi:hypothetical protein